MLTLVDFPHVELPDETVILLLIRRSRGFDSAGDVLYCKLELQEWPQNDAFLPDPDSSDWIEYIPEAP